MIFQQLSPGMFLGQDRRYRIDSQLGEGGFGKTYLATDVQLNRLCVIKRPRIDQTLSRSERHELLANFEREAQLLVTLSSPGHPSIPDIYAYLPDSNALVMKYIEGEDLEQMLLRRGPLPQAEAIGYVREVCNALIYMHNHSPQPILHRDIKPSNIVVARNTHVWLIDFGLSRATPGQFSQAALQGTRGFGTIGFTPFEQWNGRAVPQSDVYALAITLYQLLTNHIQQIDESQLLDIALGRRPASEVLTPVRQLRPELSLQIEWLIKRAVVGDAQQRLTAYEMRSVLDALHKPQRSSGVFVIQAPDGSNLHNQQELARWCAANWEQAATWLYGRMPEQVMMFWSLNKLAQDMQHIVESYPNEHDIGLDMLLRLIATSPPFPAPHVDVVPASLNFGALAVNQQAQRVIKLTNPGPGYVALSLTGSAWVQPLPTLLKLRKGDSAKVTVTVDTASMRQGGRRQSSVAIRSQNGFAYDLPVQVNLPFWRTLAHEFWQLAQHVASSIWHVVRRVARSAGHALAVVAAASLTLIALLFKGIFYVLWIFLRGSLFGIATFFAGGLSGLLSGALVGTLASAAIAFGASADEGLFWRILYSIVGGAKGLLSGSVVGVLSGAASGGVVGAVVRGGDITMSFSMDDMPTVISIIAGALIGVLTIALLRYTNLPGEWVQQFMIWVTPTEARLTIVYALLGGGCAGFLAAVIASEGYW